METIEKINVVRSKSDNAWKVAFHDYFKPFLQLCWPKAYHMIDWSRHYEMLNQELQEIVRDAEEGDRRADLLIRVWRKDGEEMCIFIHCEIQARKDTEFEERMFIYRYRIFDRYRGSTASLAVLIDDNPTWRPTEYKTELLDSTVMLTFPIVKLWDYKSQRAMLENSSNPFALILLAQLDANETKPDQPARLVSKVALTKRLLKKGWPGEEIRKMFLVLDWLMRLSPPLELQYINQVKEEEAAMQVEYITSVERIGIEQGIKEGIEQGIKQGVERGIEQGIKQGIEQGIKRGIEQGIERGIEQGIHLEKLDVVKKLVSLGIPLKDITLVTGLSEAEYSKAINS